MTDNVIIEINQYLTFTLAEERYAVNVANIKEVLKKTKITKVPRMLSFMRGVINLRGSVVPLIDLKEKFGIGKTDVSANISIIVTEIDNAESIGRDSDKLVISIFADSVQKVITIEPSEVKAAPKIGMAFNTDFIHGICQADGNFIIILDILRVLSSNEITNISNSLGTVVEALPGESGNV